MNYFTPELLEAGNSLDPTAADAAFQAWERAEAAYEARLKQIWPALSATVRMYLDEIRLHDAEVIAKGISNDGQAFGLVVRLKSGGTVRLHYSLASPPRFHPSTALASPLLWQYDEIDDVPGGGVSAFVHRILFTGAAELHLSFYDLSCAAYVDETVLTDAVAF